MVALQPYTAANILCVHQQCNTFYYRLVEIKAQYVNYLTKNLLQFSAALIVCGFSSSLALAQDASEQTRKPVRVVIPDKRVDAAQPATIDTEKFELGAYVGMLSVADFNTNLVTGFSLTYHITRDWLAQVQMGQSTVSRATFEDIADANFLADGEYDFTYTTLSGGYRIAHGRSFLSTKGKYDSAIYLLAGVGNIEFAGNSAASGLLGLSYRVVPTDWMTINLDFKNHLFEREFLDTTSQTMNNELNIGVNVLF